MMNLGERLSEEECNLIVDEADKDGDGQVFRASTDGYFCILLKVVHFQINYEEFYAMMCSFARASGK